MPICQKGINELQNRNAGGKGGEGMYTHKQKKEGLGTIVHACNPRYSGGRDQEDCWLRPDQAKSSRDLILTNELDINRRMEVQASLGINWRPYLKNK
jgi:hypothetical protein